MRLVSLVLYVTFILNDLKILFHFHRWPESQVFSYLLKLLLLFGDLCFPLAHRLCNLDRSFQSLFTAYFFTQVPREVEFFWQTELTRCFTVCFKLDYWKSLASSKMRPQ